jgi:hypothetical protein
MLKVISHIKDTVKKYADELINKRLPGNQVQQPKVDAKQENSEAESEEIDE